MDSDYKVYMIHNLGQGFDIRRGFDVWLYLAYSSFLISYFLPNILYIRMIIALGSLFFVIWSCVAPGLAVQMDSLLFNLLYIIINVYQIIRLLRKKIPPKFSELEEKIYTRNFQEVFSRFEFKMLLDKARVEYLSTNESQICKIGQSYREVIYVAHINEGYSVELRDINNNIISNVKEGSWIGIAEYAIREDYLKNPKLRKVIMDGDYELVWEVTASIVQNNKENNEMEKVIKKNENREQYEDFVYLKKRSEGCIVYKFTMEVILIYLIYRI